MFTMSVDSGVVPSLKWYVTVAPISTQKEKKVKEKGKTFDQLVGKRFNQ